MIREFNNLSRCLNNNFNRFNKMTIITDKIRWIRILTVPRDNFTKNNKIKVEEKKLILTDNNNLHKNINNSSLINKKMIP